MWLCEILQKYDLSCKGLDNVGAHSMKATALSWLAKAGVQEKARRMLGYHVKPKDKSLVIYSRDALAGPLAILSETVASVASGKFKPDESRSGRWASEAVVKTVESDRPEDEGDEVLDVQEPKPAWTEMMSPSHKKVERLVEYDNQSSESSESAGEESEDGEAERAAETVVTGLVGPPKKMGVGMYRHGLSGTIHNAGTEDGFLACGRKISAVMIKLLEEVHGVGSMCKVCTGYRRG